MRKSELHADHNSGKNNSTRRRDLKRLRTKESDIFTEAGADPGGPDAILPFLKERIAFEMPSDIKYLSGVLDYLNERMLKFGIVNAPESEVLIALDEAIVNAIKHGNKSDPRKAVHIIAEMSSDGARFTVTDEGPGFARDKVPDPTDPSRLLIPSGRGLLLINHIMDEVFYNKCGNEVQMFKRSSQNADPQPAQRNNRRSK